MTTTAHSPAKEFQEARRYQRRAAVSALPHGLSPHEMMVLEALSRGLTDHEIAYGLGITKFTVNKHVGAILRKMDVRSRTAAAVRAVREHIVP